MVGMSQKPEKSQNLTAKKLNVTAIENGTVIDHMLPGSAIKVLELFDLAGSKRNQITVGINLKCQDGSLKDIIKIQNQNLTDLQQDNIAVFSPKATINIIEKFQVVNKFPVKVPKQLRAILKCPNAACISNHQPIDSCFEVTRALDNACELQCSYCDKYFRKVF